MDFIDEQQVGSRFFLSPEDRPFYFALGASLVIHLITVGYLSSKKANMLNASVKPIEVTYQRIENKKIEEPLQEDNVIKAVKQEPVPKEVDILSKDNEEFPFLSKTFKDISKLSEHFSFSQKQSPQIKTLDMSRNVSVPMFEGEKISNPKYLSYNQNIRQLIKQQAYRYVENPEFRAGEVYLTFILGANGQLKDLQIIEGRSHASDFLKNAGIRSIKDADPFPPFPTDLKYPELTFNVVISFEVNE